MKNLLDEFKKSTFEDWTAQAVKDLKGKDFNETLLWKPYEGFEVAPYLTENKVDDGQILTIQSVQKKEGNWLNLPKIIFENEKISSDKIKNFFKNGADGVVLDILENPTIDFSKLLHGIKLSDTPIFFISNSTKVISELKKFINYKMKGGLMFDAVSFYFHQIPISKNYFEDLATTIHQSLDSPSFHTVGIDCSEFHNAGANAVQELAFGISSAVTFLDKLTDLGLDAQTIAQKIFFNVSVGTNYFMEIAKLRALRVLWNRILQSYNLPNSAVYILANNSVYFDAAQSPHTNILRASTEAMSAVMGGCDALSLHAFNATFEQPDEFSERIAMNISTIFKEEAHLDKVADSSAGSYYIENLTIELVNASWKLFLEIEEMGGYLLACESGYIKEQLDNSRKTRQANIENGSEIRVGVNKYQEKS